MQQRLALLNGLEIETSWVAACLRDFNAVWELLTPQSRARLVRAVVSHVDIDEPANEIRAFLVNLSVSGPHPLSGED